MLSWLKWIDLLFNVKLYVSISIEYLINEKTFLFMRSHLSQRNDRNVKCLFHISTRFDYAFGIFQLVDINFENLKIFPIDEKSVWNFV